MRDLSVHFSSDTIEWESPWELYESYEREFGIVLDVCATERNSKARHCYTPEMDGLGQPWAADARELGGAGWMNPPYGDPEHPCKPKCIKKRCQPCTSKCKPGCRKHRGHHISVYVPGICDWVKKASHESGLGLTLVSLLPSRTDTAWWHTFIWDGWSHHPQTRVEVRLLRGRQKFGEALNSAPFPSAVVVFRGAR